MKNNTSSLKDKIILITGGSSGLGEQIAYEAAKNGAIVIVCARRLELLADITQKCEQLSGNRAYAFQLDVADFENSEQVCKRIYAQIGPVDILVNCAGFGIFEDFTKMDMTTTTKMFQVNVLGLMYLTQTIAIEMVERGQGQIINIASQAGKVATPKSAVYAATKAAVISFSNALRLELKPIGIVVTTVNPGPIATNFFSQADPSGQYLESVDRFVLQPEKLAKKTVAVMGTKRREMNDPWLMNTASKLYILFPHIGDFLAGSVFNKK